MCRKMKVYVTVCHAHVAVSVRVEFSRTLVGFSSRFFWIFSLFSHILQGLRLGGTHQETRPERTLAHAVASSRAPWLIRDRGWPGVLGGKGVEKEGVGRDMEKEGLKKRSGRWRKRRIAKGGR